MRRLALLEPSTEMGSTRRLDLGLVLTHACNLACTYCYTGEKKRVRMPEAVARRALDLGFSTVNEGELQVTFFGGEPLLEQELVLALAKEARGRETDKLRVHLQMTTNGTLLDERLLGELHAARVHLALSIDGTQRAHELNRPLAGGGSSFPSVRAALDLLLSRKRAFDVIAVVDPSTLSDLSQGVQELLDRRVDAITLNPNWGARWEEAALVTFERELERIAAIFIAWLRQGRWVRIEPLTSVIHALSDSASPRLRCEAGARRIAVAPSGRLYPCPRSVGEDAGDGALGHLDHGLSLAARASEARCYCAAKEEATGDAIGPVQARVDAMVEALATRVLGLVRKEYALVSVIEDSDTERSPNAIPY